MFFLTCLVEELSVLFDDDELSLDDSSLVLSFDAKS